MLAYDYESVSMRSYSILSHEGFCVVVSGPMFNGEVRLIGNRSYVKMTEAGTAKKYTEKIKIFVRESNIKKFRYLLLFVTYRHILASSHCIS